MDPIKVPPTIPQTALSPSNTPNSVLSTTDQLGSAYNNFMTQLADLTKQYSTAMTPTSQEQDLIGQLNALNQGERQGLLNTENKVIPMEFITGQQASIQKQAAINRQALSENLSALQENRQAQLDSLSKQIELANLGYSTTAEFDKLQREANKLDTNIVTLDNGRTLLVDTQTGNIIKDYGGIKPETGYGFGFGGMGGFDTTTSGTSFDEWLNEKELTDMMSYDTSNPQVLQQLQSEYQAQTGNQPQTSSFLGSGGVDQVVSFIRRKVTDADAPYVIESFKYNYLNSPDKEEFVKDYIKSYLSDKKLEEYNSAEGISLALQTVQDELNAGNVKTGPFRSAGQSILRTIGKSDPYYESIKTLFSKGKAEERLRLFGASLTTGEQSSARDFLPDEKDNTETLKFKIETMIGASQLAQERILKQSVGLPYSADVTTYLQTRKEALDALKSGKSTIGTATLPSQTSGVDYRTLYNY